MAFGNAMDDGFEPVDFSSHYGYASSPEFLDVE